MTFPANLVLDLIRKAGTPVEVTLYETSVVEDPPHPDWIIRKAGEK